MTNQLDECCSIPGVLSREGRMVFSCASLMILICPSVKTFLMIHIYPVRFPEIYATVYPDWTCGTPTPDRGGSLQHRRGLNPQPRVQPPLFHCTLAPEGFEPLAKGS